MRKFLLVIVALFVLLLMFKFFGVMLHGGHVPGHVGLPVVPNFAPGTFILALPILVGAFLYWIFRKSHQTRTPEGTLGPELDKLMRDLDRLEDRIGNIETIMMDRQRR